MLRARRTARIGFVAIGLLIPAAAWLIEPAADGKQGTARPAGVSAFRSCDGLIGYARTHGLNVIDSRERAMRQRTVNALPTNPVPLTLGAPEADARSAPASQPGIDHSTTNVQEAGVDEPDIVKTDGSTIFAVAGRKLHAVDATTNPPRLVGSLALEGWGHQLLLRGEKLLVVSSLHSQETLISEVSVSNPAVMRVIRTLRIGGSYISSRLNGGTARLVITSHPRALDPPQSPAPVPQSDDVARARVMRAGASGWLPTYVLRNRRTGRVAKHRLVRCRSVRHAREFSGLDLLTVLTVDLDKGLPAVDSDALMTDADTVYASPRSLYVATQKWFPPEAVDQVPAGSRTAIHRFDTAEPDRTVYRASGYVPGFLLNQFSLSEHRGVLRVASTEEPLWSAGGQSRQSESFVTVLDERDGKLVKVGQVGGLGRGERIYSVRFIGDNGFVVTFRQVDPLYTIDLSSPERPKVLGELKVRGYSAYLHPVSGDLLIGVGQDATEQGLTLGTQISLFDISDLRRPRRLDQRTLAGMGSSEVEWDHHAFLYWPPAKLAVMPVTVHRSGPPWGPEFGGAIGYRIRPESGIDEVGRVSHGRASPDGAGAPIRRSLVAGEQLFTVSERGIAASSLNTLGGIAWVPFG